MATTHTPSLINLTMRGGDCIEAEFHPNNIYIHQSTWLQKKSLLFRFLIQVCQYEYFKGFHQGLGQQTIIRFKSVTAYWLRLIPYTTQDRVKEQWVQCKIISSPDMSWNAVNISKWGWGSSAQSKQRFVLHT